MVSRTMASWFQDYYQHMGGGCGSLRECDTRLP